MTEKVFPMLFLRNLILLTITFFWFGCGGGGSDGTTDDTYDDVVIETEPFVLPDEYDSKVSIDDINLSSGLSYEKLKAEGFQPRNDVEPWPFEIPVDWSADPFEDSNWLFQLQAWRGIDPILSQYFDTGDVAYLNEAISFVADWHKFYEENSPTKFTWNDMATGIRAMRLAFYIDAIYRGAIEVTDETADLLLSVADEHARRLQDESFISLGNHGVFQVFGLNLLCSVISERSSCLGGQAFASRMFEKILANEYTDEGVHKEHSPAYHYFTTQKINKLDPSKLASEMAGPLMEKARRIEPWLVLPDGNIVEVGDSVGKSGPLEGNVEQTCLEAERCYAVGDFTRSGYAIVRSDPGKLNQSSMLFVMGMAYSTAHKHADDLSFVLFEHGEPVFIDSGKYGYNHDFWRDYVKSAAAHNTISLAKEAIDSIDVQMSGSLLDAVDVDNQRFVIYGEVYRPGFFTQYRTIEYSPGLSLVIRDELSSGKERAYVSSLHISRHLMPKLVEGGFNLQLNNGELIYAQLENEDCDIEKVRGQKDPVLGWQSVGYLEMEPTNVVRATCYGRDRSITWSIKLGP